MSVLVHDRIRGTSGRALALNALALIAGSLLVAALAQVEFHLPFTPVPVTGQTLGVLLVGAALGAKRGAAAIALYLAEGALGMPVFAGGKGGVVWLLPASVTGGFLWAFLACAFVVGLLADREWDRNAVRLVPALVAGEIVIFAIGVPWVAAALDVSLAKAVALACTPFLAGETIKMAVVAGVLPGAWKLREILAH